MKHSVSRTTLFILIGLTCISGSTHRSGASDVELNSIDQIDQSFRVSVNDSSDINYPAVLEVKGASLDSTDPSDSSKVASAGSIFLTLNLTASPARTQFGNANWGDFYSDMTPLPATALRYLTASGRSYVSTRIDINTQASFANADEDDGLVDATYYFTVPITNRSGTFEILPSRTSGMQYENFVGIGTTTLITGGPVRVALHFPKLATDIAKRPPANAPGVAAATYTTFASMLNFVSTILGLFLLAGVYLWTRRARRRRYTSRRPVYFDSEDPVPGPPEVTDTVMAPTPPVRSDIANQVRLDGDPRLRVNVLGSLTIFPTNGPLSDPVRAIVAYLAMHTERALTLDEIQNSIWTLTDKGNDIKRPAMRNYMAHARKAVGDLHLPTASGRPGYQLVDITTDWNEFQALLAQAGSAEKEVARELRKEALSLVRGEPFTADTSRYFTWAFSSAVVYKIVESVTTLAHSLGTEMVLASDLPGAEWALRQGLLCDPASLTLWEDLTDVLLEATDQSLLDLHWKAATLVLDSKDVVALRARENG